MPTNDLFMVMAGRRTCKRFAAQPVEMDKVLQIVQAGMLAPSSGNIQNWTFTVLTDIGLIRGMYSHALDQEPFLTATGAIIVCGNVDHAHTLYGMRGKRLYTTQNCAAAIQNMLLAAEALGIGSAWIGAFDEDKIAAMFGIPSSHRAQAVILLGYPAETADPKDLKPLEQVVFFNRFGNKVLRPHLIYYDLATEWRNQAQKLKAHAADAVHRARERLPKKDPEAPPVKERMKTSFEQASERIRESIDRLKKDEYRKK